MEIGTEISHKIRSAIKAKLVELGAYVDDELPDYIMVLVANKKTQSQMAEDLNLFLGKNTEIFSTWLHLLLSKLQTITAELPAAKSVTQASHDSHVTEPALKPAASSKDKDSSSPPAKTSSAPAEPAKPTVTTVIKKHEAVKPVYTDQLEEPILTFTAENDEFVEEDIPKERFSQPTKAGSPQKKNAEVTAKVSPRVRVDPPSPAKVVTRVVAKAVRPVSQRVSRVSPHREYRSRASDRRDVRSAPSSRSAEQNRRTTVYAGGRKVPGSVVASVVKHNHQDSDDEYDPLNPSVGNVASVVRVTERRSSVPPAMQANKSLLMKAVSEAQKSIDIATKKLEERGKQYQATQPQQRVQRISRQPIADRLSADTRRSIQLPRRQDRSEKTAPVIRSTMGQVKVSVSRSSLSEDVRVDENSEYDRSVERSVVRSSPVREQDEETVCQDAVSDEETRGSPDLQKEDRRLVEYRRSPQQEHRKYELKEYEEEEVDIVEEEAEYKQQFTDSVEPYSKELPDYEDNDIEDSISLAVAEHSRKVESRKKSFEQPASPKFIVTLDGTGAPPQAHMKDVDIDIEVKSIHQATKRRSSGMSSILDDDSEGEESLSPTAAKKTKVLEKCKFWPNCKNGETCPYHHPSIKCKSFPKCTYGEKCHFIHPKCKYDAMCTKSSCPFTHTSKKPVTQLQPFQVATPVFSIHPKTIAKMTAVSPPASPASTVCRFYPNCHNMNCSFKHPKPCRFGISCNNKNECQFHHPKLPGKDKLKWTAASVF